MIINHHVRLEPDALSGREPPAAKVVPEPPVGRARGTKSAPGGQRKPSAKERQTTVRSVEPQPAENAGQIIYGPDW